MLPSGNVPFSLSIKEIVSLFGERGEEGCYDQCERGEEGCYDQWLSA